MGLLRLFCATSDGHSIYGLATGGNFSDPAAAQNGNNRLLILVRSNADPVDLKSLIWTLVSTVRLSAVYDITRSPQSSQACAVDSKGVFTYLSQSVYKTPSTEAALGGVQYSPLYSANSNGGSTGPGGWKNIDFQVPYTWQQSSTLFPVQDTTGLTTFVQAYLSTASGSGIQFGTLDSTAMLMKQGPLWTMNTEVYGNVSNIDFLNNNLYLLGNGATSAGSTAKNLTLFSVPFASPTISTTLPTAGIKFYDAKSVAFCFDPANGRTGVVANSYFVLCNSLIHSIGIMDLTYSTAIGPFSTLSESVPASNLDIFQPIGGYNGETAFALVQTTTPTTNATQISGLNLNGGNAAQWQHVSYSVNVTEFVGINPNPNSSLSTPSSTSGVSAKDDSSSPSAGLVAGCVAAALVVIAAALSFGYYRRVVLVKKAQQKAKKDKEQHQHPQNPPSTDAGARSGSGELRGPDAGLTDAKYLVDTPSNLQKRPYDPYFDEPRTMAMSIPAINHPATIHRTAVASPVASSILPDPILQAHMNQQFRFASHPRPNFVTSVATSAEDDTQQQQQQHYHSHSNNSYTSSPTSAAALPNLTGGRSSDSSPSLPTHTRPTGEGPANNSSGSNDSPRRQHPHALVTEVLASLPVRAPHTPASDSTSSVYYPSSTTYH
ncbi:hypothetical protein EDD11_006591 [Mortierella claussenii]|nr:hypothetical protein EDD11_006591 [Mortierella claussenii]